MDWAQAYVEELSRTFGAPVEPSDITRLHEYKAGIDAGTTTQAQLEQHMEALRVQYQKRGAGTGHRNYDSQSGLYADVGGDPQTEPGYVETRDTSQPLFRSSTAIAPFVPSPPPPMVSKVTTIGAAPSAQMTPTVGPTGLAYQDDPVNYSTMQVSPAYGYTQGGALQSGTYPTFGGGGGGIMAPTGGRVGGQDNTMIYILIGGAALAAYFLLSK